MVVAGAESAAAQAVAPRISATAKHGLRNRYRSPEHRQQEIGGVDEIQPSVIVHIGCGQTARPGATAKEILEQKRGVGNVG